MEYSRKIILKDGRTCILRSGTAADAEKALANFVLTHAQTDWLTTYPDENTTTVEEEATYLRRKHESADEVELVAEVDGAIVGTAGIERVGAKDKLKHRAELGISIDSAFWGQGIGRAMIRACIECAKRAGYAQLELSVVADNARAYALYQSEGFVEYGRNPLGFSSRLTGWQPVALMRLELDSGENSDRITQEGETYEEVV